MLQRHARVVGLQHLVGRTTEGEGLALVQTRADLDGTALEDHLAEFDVPRDQLAQAIGVTPTPGKRRTLAQLAAERGTDTAVLKAQLRQAITDLQAQRSHD